MNHNEEILQRIDDLLKRNHIQQKDLIAHLGLSRGTYTNWIRKTSTSYLSYLGEIACFLGVNVNYLVTGSPDMSSNLSTFVLSPEEERYLACFREVPESDRDLMLDMNIFLSNQLRRRHVASHN